VAMLVIVVAVIVAVPILLRQVRHRHDQRMTSSCANHVIQLRFLVLSFADREQRFPLETDARTAFVKMRQPGEQPDWWFTSVSSACPESFLHGNSIGYVFVADGLSTKTAVEQSALVFFCPADSHQRSVQHCHAVIGRGELVCIKSNAEMIDLLRREIGRAKGGIVPYSTNALSQMERELDAREKHARSRGPNEITSADGGWRILFSFLAQRPAATEFCRSAETGGPNGWCVYNGCEEGPPVIWRQI
jgi:hypothetical protein